MRKSFRYFVEVIVIITEIPKISAIPLAIYCAIYKSTVNH